MDLMRLRELRTMFESRCCLILKQKSFQMDSIRSTRLRTRFGKRYCCLVLIQRSFRRLIAPRMWIACC